MNAYHVIIDGNEAGRIYICADSAGEAQRMAAESRGIPEHRMGEHSFVVRRLR